MSKISIQDETNMFKNITEQMLKTFIQKRNDYGQTTEETFKRFGPISLYVRMFDKMSRLENLFTNKRCIQVKDETVEDTLLDLANYCIITIIEMTKQKCEVIGNEKIHR